MNGPSIARTAPLIAVLAILSGCGDPEAPRDRVAESTSKTFVRVETFGGLGVAPGRFNKPRSVVCDRDDNVYVVDMTGRVQRFTPDGRFVLQWQLPETDLGRPKGLGLDRDGNILVVEPHYQRVNHFTPEGKLVAQWGSRGTEAGRMILPRAVVQRANGDFLVSEYTLAERIQVFPASVAAAGAAKSDGPLPTVRTWGSPGLDDGQFNRAEGMGLGPDGTVWVADSCNHRLQAFDAEGRFLRSWGRAGSAPGMLSYPYDVRVDREGVVFVCEFGNSRITVLEADGALREVVGKAGSEPGEFANPWGIALDSKGHLYVADAMNHRVQKLLRRQEPF
jgi:sugar lactone lactonase YvrE